MNKDESYDRGRAMRFDMFGEPGVRSLDNVDDFNEPLQDLVTRLCFGDVWSRPGLDRKTRSMLTIAILIGQSRPDQLRNHINGALANGVTKEEITEILLQVAIYGGVPAGVDAFRNAKEAIADYEAAR